MVADPFATVSFASAIIQLIDFSIKVARRIEDYQSCAASVPQYLRDVNAQLKLLSATLPRTKDKADSGSLTDESKLAVQDVAVGCQRQVSRLASIIEKLLPKTVDSRWQRQKRALFSFQYEKEIKSIDSALQRYMQSLIYHESTNPSSPTIESTPSSSERPPLFDIPFSRDDDFIGREEVLSRLFSASIHGSRCTIVGIGGVG